MNKLLFISSLVMQVICAGIMCVELLHGDMRGHLHALLCFILVIYYMIASYIFYKEVKKDERRKSLKFTPLM